MKNHQQISKKAKEESDQILQNKKVIETLERFGKVTITGSYAYGVMYGPDIDVVVESDDPEQASHEVLKAFIENKGFQKYQLGDFKNYPRENRPESFIVVLILEVEGVKWEIEMWFHNEYPEGGKLRDKVMNEISEEQKDVIIKIKHERSEAGLSGKDLESVDIYDGVINEGKSELAEFL